MNKDGQATGYSVSGLNDPESAATIRHSKNQLKCFLEPHQGAR